MQCIRTYFKRRYDFEGLTWPRFRDIVREYDLDVEVRKFVYKKKVSVSPCVETDNVQVAASGFTKEKRAEYEELEAEHRRLEKEAGIDTSDPHNRPLEEVPHFSTNLLHKVDAQTGLGITHP